jgi:L-threonylcarbamoyladenylate synthase
MKIIAEKDADIAEIINFLQKGKLVVFPCETVYGIAVDAHSPEAVLKLAKYKQRPLGKPYAVMVANQKIAERYVELNTTAKQLYKNFLPGPITVVSKGKHVVANGIESEAGTLGVRIPDYPFMIKLLTQFDGAIVATSANKSYEKRPYKVADLDISKSDLVIDAGELPHNEPSTVVDTTLDDMVVLRQGDIKLKDKNEVLSSSEDQTQNLGKELWQKYEKYAGSRAIIFALEGPMGAGKTQLTKGLGRAMGVGEEIVSPTFNLQLSYLTPSPLLTSGEGQLSLNHIDAWRMAGGSELEEVGFKNLISDKSVVVIEWAERVADAIRKYHEEAVIVWVKISYADKENERRIGWGVL